MKKFLVLVALLLAGLLAGVAHGQVVVEYRNDLDFTPPEVRFFITADPVEQAAVDGGGVGHWVRTGNSFKSGGDTQVCRFYGSVSPGPNSHFYTADANECEGLKSLPPSDELTVPAWHFESRDFVTSVPVNGMCAAGLTPVYRAYNNGFARGVDSNHRLTSNFAAIAEVVAKGWVSEGVVMCAPAPLSCIAPKVWNGNACATPEGIKVAGPPVHLPAGCRMWTEKCYQDAISTISWASSPAVATGLSDRPIVWGYFINGTTPNPEDGPYSANPFYADTMEPFSGNGIYHGVNDVIDWVMSTKRGLIKHIVDGPCYEMIWYGAPYNVWNNDLVVCPKPQ